MQDLRHLGPQQLLFSGADDLGSVRDFLGPRFVAPLEDRFVEILRVGLLEANTLFCARAHAEPPLPVKHPLATIGTLMAIEGIDASGKGTQADLLLERTRSSGLRAVRLSFPRYGETAFSRLVADYLNGNFGTIDTVPAQFSAVLFAGDRFESRHLLERLMASHDIVILDRYVTSNLAYHAARVPASERLDFMYWLKTLEYETFGLPRPHATVLLDVPPSVTGQWVLKKGPRSYTEHVTDIHERRLDYMQQCRDMFLQIGDTLPSTDWHTIVCTDESSTSRSQQEIADDIWNFVGPIASRHQRADRDRRP